MTEKTESRTSAATEAAARAALRRRLQQAAGFLREHGWSVSPPAAQMPVTFNDLGQSIPANGGEVSYRCPVDGKESWYIAASDRFYHCDGSDNRRCRHSMHRGELAWPTPVIIRAGRS